MKCWYGSDLHSEFWGAGVKITDLLDISKYDLFFLAGDAGVWSNETDLEVVPVYYRVLEPLLEAGKQVFLTPGNHEFYGCDLRGTIEEMRELDAKVPNFHFLYGDTFRCGDIAVSGGTLWTPGGPDSITQKRVQSALNDYRMIKIGDRRLRVKDTIKEHQELIRCLYEGVPDEPGVKKIILTHHAPLWRSYYDDKDAYKYAYDLHPKARAVKYAYVADQHDLIEYKEPDIWIHGHLHGGTDYRQYGCRILNSPYGYDREGAPIAENSLRLAIPRDGVWERTHKGIS